MSASGMPLTPRTEAELIETLRKTYEDRGFEFFSRPSGEALPDFLSSFRPDAIARKPGENIVVEVKTPQDGAAERPIADLRRRLSAHPDWKLDVVYLRLGDTNELAIPAAEASTVRTCLNEITTLSQAGHTRAAFLLAWSVLEASLGVGTTEARRPRTAAQVVQWLAMNGHIEAEKEPTLLDLANLRNRLAHGDLSVDASKESVDFLSGVIRDSIVAEAA